MFSVVVAEIKIPGGLTNKIRQGKEVKKVNKCGLIAEKLAKELFVEVFNFNGILARKSTDKGMDIIWVKIGKGEYAAIELSLNKNSILGSKGVEAIHRGIVPMWIDEKELEISFVQKDGKKMVQKVRRLIKKIVKTFSLNLFKEPSWTEL